MGVALAGLAALAIVAYLPALSQPLIEDDYPNIAQALRYGDVTGWSGMLADPIFRVRATTWLLMYGVNRIFDMQTAGYYAALIGLHVVNTWLVFALGAWRRLGYRLTFFAAGFFAVYEGHQEAVMWLSGSTEPLLVLFGLLAFLAWIHFLGGRGVKWYFASLVSFCFALVSKESAVILVPLLAMVSAVDGVHREKDARRRWREIVWLLLPFAALSLVSAISILITRSYSFRFQDGSFSLHAPVWRIWPSNFARLFWFWGLLAVAGSLAWRPAHYLRILGFGVAWAGVSLIPYSFLTYSTRIPSRQTHLASVGIAIVVGLALRTLYDRYWSGGRALVIAVCAVMVAHNVVYLWTKKRAQYLERAAPTEQLIALARKTNGPIYVKCFPRAPIVAESAIALTTSSSLIWTAEEARRRPAAATFCYSKP